MDKVGTDVTFDDIKTELYKMLCDTSVDGNTRVECARLLFTMLEAEGPDPSNPPSGPNPLLELGGSMVGGIASALAGGLVRSDVSLHFQGGKDLVLTGNLAAIGPVLTAPKGTSVEGVEISSQQPNKLTSES